MERVFRVGSCISLGVGFSVTWPGTAFFLCCVAFGFSPMGVVFGLLWNQGVLRPNVATLKGVTFGISRTIAKRLDLTFGSSLCLRFPPIKRADPQTRGVYQTGNKQKNARGAT